MRFVCQHCYRNAFKLTTDSSRPNDNHLPGMSSSPAGSHACNSQPPTSQRSKTWPPRVHATRRCLILAPMAPIGSADPEP